MKTVKVILLLALFLKGTLNLAMPSFDLESDCCQMNTEIVQGCDSTDSDDSKAADQEEEGCCNEDTCDCSCCVHSPFTTPTLEYEQEMSAFAQKDIQSTHDRLRDRAHHSIWHPPKH